MSSFLPEKMFSQNFSVCNLSQCATQPCLFLFSLLKIFVQLFLLLEGKKEVKNEVLQRSLTYGVIRLNLDDTPYFTSKISKL